MDTKTFTGLTTATGALKFSLFGTGFAKFDASGNVSSVVNPSTDTTSVVGAGALAKFYYPTYYGNAGTAIIEQFNRVQVGEASLTSGDVLSAGGPPPGLPTTPSWVDVLLQTPLIGQSQLASVGTFGNTALAAATRTSDYTAAFGGGAPGGNGAGTFVAYSDLNTLSISLAGSFISIRKPGISHGVVLGFQSDVNITGSVAAITPYGGIVDNSSMSALYTPGAFNQLGTISNPLVNPSAALVVGRGGTTYPGSGSSQTFNKGLVFLDGSLASAGLGGNGIAIEFARNQSIRWLNSSSTADGEIFADNFGIVENIPTGTNYVFQVNASNVAYINSAAVQPANNNAISCGTSGQRWTDVFSYKIDAASTIHLLNNTPIQARNAANSVDVNIAYLDASDVFQIGGGDPVNIASVSASTSTTTGALTVAGGSGIVGSLNVGGNVTIGAATPTNRFSIKGDAAGFTNLVNTTLSIEDSDAANGGAVGGRLLRIANRRNTGSITQNVRTTDGTNWNLDVTSNYGLLVQLNNQSFFVATASPGANPRTMTTWFVVDGTSGKVGIGTVAPGFLLDVNGTANFSGAVTLAADPTVALGAATKQYVDSVAFGLQIKSPVAVATTANITLSGEQTIDGITTSASRVLVKNQIVQANNGIYVSAAGAWARASDLDTWAKAVGAYAFVSAGTVGGTTGWATSVTAGGTIGVTAMPWAQFSANTAYTAGSGLTLSGNVFSIATSGVTNAMLAGSIAASKLVGTDITTVGTITSGTWSGSFGAVSGANLTTLNGSNISSGTVDDARLPTSLVTKTLIGTTTLTGTAHFPNNVGIQHRNFGNSIDINTIYLDPSDVFQLGGGTTVNVAAVTASTVTTDGAFTVRGGIGSQGLVNAVGFGAFAGTNSRLSTQANFSLSDGILLNVTNAAGSVNTGLEVRANTAIFPVTTLFGINTATPGAIGAGTGAAFGISAGVLQIAVTPYVDTNPTTAALVVQTVDQPGANTNGGTGYEYAIIGGIKSTHNDGSLGPNKVGVAGMSVMSGATSGNGWGGYFLTSLDSGCNASSIGIGVEIDLINSTTGNRNYSNLGTPAYGLQITGTSNKTNTAALLISGAPGAPQWYAGIVFNNVRSATCDYGIDFAFDGNTTFGQCAIRLPNNQSVAWKHTTGINVNCLYMDSHNVFQLGGGFPVGVAGLSPFANNGAAVAAGLPVGTFYRNGGNPDLVCVVH